MNVIREKDDRENEFRSQITNYEVEISKLKKICDKGEEKVRNSENCTDQLIKSLDRVEENNMKAVDSLD
jgi:hypothetical protein